MTEGIYDAGRAAQDLALSRDQGRCYEAHTQGLCTVVRREGLWERWRKQGPRLRLCCETWALAVVLALVFGVVLVPNAYASTGGALSYDDMAVVWGPNSVGVGYGEGTIENGVVVLASDRYLAAIVTLGISPTDSRLTHDNKAKLSNESTGGAFYTFAQLYQKFQTSGQPLNYPSWNGAVPTAVLDTVGTLYGGGNVWWADYTNAQYASALEDLNSILAGNDLAGGSGVQEQDGYAILNCTTNYGSYQYGLRNTSDSKIYYFDSKTPRFPNTYTLRIPIAMYNTFDFSTYDYYLKLAANVSNRLYFNIRRCAKGTATLAYGTGLYNTRYVSKITFSGPSYISEHNNIGYTFDGSVITLNNVTPSYTYISRADFFDYYPYEQVIDFNAMQPVIPETNWPEPGDPVPDPDPPEVPDVPDDDPIEQPNPVNPTPPQQPTDVVGGTPPQYDPIMYPVDSTFTVDIQGILDAMAEHCRHLQAALHTLGENLSDNITNAIFDNVSWLYDMVYQQFGWIGNIIKTEGQSLRSNIYGNVGYLGDTIVDEFDSLKTYLQSLFTWLGQQMNYTVNIDKDSYDDSSVLYWLKRIWAKLGAGDINTRPTDPVADPWDIGEWLKQLWANFTADLIAMGADLLADLAMDLRDLVTKFPFSIPWDIAALLAVLAAEPVAPEIVWPWFTVGTNGGIVSTNITISLDDYDDYLGGVRTMEKLLFVGYLLFRVKDDIALLFSGGLDA